MVKEQKLFLYKLFHSGKMSDKETAPQCENEKVETTEAKTAEGKDCSPKSSPSKIET